MILACVRVPLASVFAIAGLSKLVRLPEGAREGWNPFPRADVAWTLAYAAIGVVELFMALAMLFAPGPAVALLAASFVAVATAYGLISLRRTGSCGCFGSSHGSTSLALLIRNASMVASCLVLGIVDPRSPLVDPSGVPWVPMVTAVLLVGFALAAWGRGPAAKEWYRRSR
jgi:hypothetical protein